LNAADDSCDSVILTLTPKFTSGPLVFLPHDFLGFRFVFWPEAAFWQLETRFTLSVRIIVALPQGKPLSANVKSLMCHARPVVASLTAVCTSSGTSILSWRRIHRFFGFCFYLRERTAGVDEVHVKRILRSGSIANPKTLFLGGKS
jgi:hypothetical protein